MADPAAAFTKALELDFDATPFLGNVRGKRYALTTEDGKITAVNVEDEVSKVDKSGVDNVLA